MCKTINRMGAYLLSMLMLCAISVPRQALADANPPGCGTAGIQLTLEIRFADGVTVIPAGTAVAPCETIVVVGSVNSVANTCCIEGGTMTLTDPNGGTHDVTPGTIPLLCAGAGVASVPFSFTFANATPGTKTFILHYSGIAHEQATDVPGSADATIQKTTTVAPCPGPGPCQVVVCDPARRIDLIGGGFRLGACVTNNLNPPTCTISPPTANICEGTSQNFTVSITPNDGTAPIVISWTKNGAPFNGSAATITATAPASGVTDTYVATIVSANGCTNTCTATLTSKPNPTCTITGDSPVCQGTTHTYTSAVLPVGGTVTHNWTISGNGTINGSTTDASVSVTAGAAGSFTLTDTITRDGCPGQCTLTVPVNPNPTCIITGDLNICEGTTHTYTSAVSPSDGNVTHSWTISGNGTINGPVNQATVSVTAGPFSGGASFTLVDVISRDGCPGRCELVVPIRPCNPAITVDKQVACVPASGACDATLTYANSATGVQGAAFCYRITVCNPPTATEPLINVVVNDPDLGGNLPGFPTTLAIGQCETRFFKKTWPVASTPAEHVNTVRASGVGETSQISTNDVDDATVNLLPIGLECDVTLVSSFDLEGSCDVTLPTDSVNTPVTFTLALRNTGSLPLVVTSLNGLPSLTDCASGAPVVVAFPITLAVGETKSITGCVSVSCPAGAQYTVSAHADVDAQGGQICIHDSNGNVIGVDSSPCTACVDCAEAVTCRVTGGGQLIPGFVDQSCIEVNTTIFPFTSPNGLTIKKITHGGQLGAPFSQEDCGTILGNPCIRGQWQHTRHYEGTANPRDVFDMNFHSQTPKGVYDSLMCACLGCCDPETGAFITPITVGGLCNPDDHKVCGPEPRPAPANAIIWSGIGRVTPTDDARGSRAAQAEWVIFRVYIEDRSEPGGGHPGGAVEPADIYCFQAWKTGIKVSKKPDFSTISAEFRAQLGQANCDFLESLKSGAVPIGTLPPTLVGGVEADIVDCGPMHDGNHQIHPSTGATCTQ